MWKFVCAVSSFYRYIDCNGYRLKQFIDLSARVALKLKKGQLQELRVHIPKKV